MEIDRTPQSGSDPGMYGCDREVFERVWQRVMPEERCERPGPLAGGKSAARLYDTAGGGPDPDLPEPPRPPESSCPCADPAVRCLGEGSAIYSAELQRFLADELADHKTYLAMAQRVRGTDAARMLAGIAADEMRHAKRLSTAYFLISGVRYWPMPSGTPRMEATLPAQLRIRFCAEQRGEAAYAAAAAETQDPCLHELYSELAGDENSHVWLLRGILEGL